MVLSLLALTSLVGCFGDSAEAPSTDGAAKGSDAAPILVLDLTQGERIIDVIHGGHDASHSAALYHLGTHDGDRLFIGGQRSNTFDRIDDAGFLGASPRAYARTHSGELTGFLAWNGSAFADSSLYEQVKGVVELEEGVGAFAFVGRKNERDYVVRYDGTKFTEIAEGDYVDTLSPSPDGRVATFSMYDAKQRVWGIDTRRYTAPPDWYALGGGKFAVTGITATGAEVMVDLAVVATHDELGRVAHDEGRSILAWSARNGETWSVQVASLASGAAPLAKVDGFTGGATALGIHGPSGFVQAVAPSAEGEKFVVGAAGNVLAASGGFERVFLANSDYKATPMAFGVSSKLTTVLVGTQASPQWTEVERLDTTHNGENFLYVATDAAGTRAVDAKKTHTVYAELGNFSRTENDLPVYVGKNADSQAVVFDGTDGPSVVSVEYVVMRSGDSIAWLANVAGGMAVGRELQLGETYGKIIGINLTRNGDLWYDGTRGDKWHRVLEDKASAGYSNLGPVTETDASDKLAWIGRDVTIAGERASMTATVRDSVVVGTEPITQLDFTAVAKDALQIAQGKDIPYLRAVSGSDSVYYTARKDNGVAVGMDAQVYGPFDEVKNLILTPDSSDIAFLARKGTWAAQVGGDRHTELTDASYLRFTPNGKEVRYEGKRDKTSVSFVGKDEFLSVKAESINGNGDVYAFAGLQADGWHVSVSEPGSATRTTSAAFAEVSSLGFTPDWFGIDAVVTDGAGAHVMRKKVGAAPELLGAWTSAWLPQYHPLAKASVEMSAWSAPDRIAVAGFGGQQPASIYVAVKRGDYTVQTLRVKAVDESGLTVEGTVLPEALNGEPDFRIEVHAFDVPFTYYVMRGKEGGDVYRETYYRRVEDRGYTTHGRWLALARGESVDAVILGERVIKTEGQIASVVPHPDLEADLRDTVAVSVYRPSDKQSGWTLLDGDAREDQLGWVDSLGEAKWTELSAKGEHTLEWHGTHASKRFHAVGKERYDSVRSVTVAPATGSLGYIGRRVHKEAVWVSGTHGTWFSRVRDLSFQGPTDIPVYIGDHVYGYADDDAMAAGVKAESDTVLAGTRRLSAVIHGDRQTGWRDDILNLVPAETLEATLYNGQQDGTWALYNGDTAAAERWEAIAYFVRTIDASGGSHTHFLGHDAQGWAEVHDGQVGTRVDALRLGKEVTRLLPATLSPVPYTSGTPDRAVLVVDAAGPVDDRAVLVDDEGRYDYVGIVGDQEVFVHQGKASGPVREVQQVSYFADGGTVAVIAKEGNHTRLIVNDKVSAPMLQIETPVFCEATNEVHARAVPILPDGLAELFEGVDGKLRQTDARRRAKEGDVEWDGMGMVLLRNAEEVARAYSIPELRVEKEGTIAHLENDDTTRLYYNGSISEAYDSILEEPSVLRKTLAESRYVVTRDERTYVAGNDVVQPAFDAVGALLRTRVADVEATLWTGRTGPVARLLMDDKEVLLAEQIRSSGLYGNWLRTEGIDGNLRFVQIGSDRFDEAVMVDAGTTSVAGTDYTPLAIARDDLRWLRDGDRTSAPVWAIWDVRGTFVADAPAAAPVAEAAPAVEGAGAEEAAPVPAPVAPPEDGAPEVAPAVTGKIVYEWLEGTFDRSAGTLTVRPARLEFVVDGTTKPHLWGELPNLDEEVDEPSAEADTTPWGAVTFAREAQLSLEARRALVRAAADVIGRPDTQVRVSSVGEANSYADRRLGVQRAEAVSSFLQSRGVEAGRIQIDRGNGADVQIELVEPPRRAEVAPRRRRAASRPSYSWDW